MFSAAAPPVTDVAYRAHATRLLGRSRQPRIRGLDIGARTAVFFSSDDLSVALVGHPVDGILGYEPKSASALMLRMLLHSAPLRPADPKK
jgi:hypothetical protein